MLQYYAWLIFLFALNFRYSFWSSRLIISKPYQRKPALVRTLLLPLKNIFHTIWVSCQTLLAPEITSFLGFSTLQLKIHTTVILHCLLVITCFPTDASYRVQFVWKTYNTFDPLLWNIILYSRNFLNFNWVIFGKGTRFDPNDDNNMCYTTHFD